MRGLRGDSPPPPTTCNLTFSTTNEGLTTARICGGIDNRNNLLNVYESGAIPDGRTHSRVEQRELARLITLRLTVRVRPLQPCATLILFHLSPVKPALLWVLVLFLFKLNVKKSKRTGVRQCLSQSKKSA